MAVGHSDPVKRDRREIRIRQRNHFVDEDHMCLLVDFHITAPVFGLGYSSARDDNIIQCIITV